MIANVFSFACGVNLEWFQSGPYSAIAGCEKGLDLSRASEKHLSGPKGPVDYSALSARLKSCPDTKHRFFAARKGPSFFEDFCGTAEAVPFQNSNLFGLISHRCADRLNP
jgi:hypothetical protein